MGSKVVLVTGASRGIGRTCLEGFARKGYKVVLNYSRSDAEAEVVFRGLSEAGFSVLKIKADISDRNQVCRMFDKISETFGMVDVLINNAGLNLDAPFLELTDESWQRVLNVSLTGTFICSQEFARHFTGEQGHIINFAASTGIKGRKNGANYCSAKAGVITLTKCMALELAPKINVNCIIPGTIDTEEVIHRYHLDNPENYQRATDTIPLGRLGTPEDIFKTIYFLVSEPTYITGQNLFINGGSYLG